MKLENLLKGLDYELVKGSIETDVAEVHDDNRKVKAGDAFIAVEGYATDGHKYVKGAFENGAKAIVISKDVENLPECTVIKVKDSRKARATIGANYYNHPAETLKIIGITGTNGKTTSTFLMKAILEAAGHKVGLIGTIANYIGSRKVEAHRTTPESLELQKMFREMLDEGCTYCIMEVSSHSLYLDRVHGIKFSQGMFTNLTQDHLDFHKTFENYYQAKLIMFKNSASSVINVDDDYGKRIFKDISNMKSTYGIDSEADLKASNIHMHARGIDFDMNFKGKVQRVHLNLPGKYNVSNALGSALCCLNEGIDLDTVVRGLENMEAVPGRCEIVTKKYNLPFEVIVDYAHTPDGLENILKTAREFTKGRLISVFGCGGDRDKTKRPLMGKIGSDLSDVAIVTSDNPRTEDPLQIIDDVVAGIQKDNYLVIENRREAIKKAMEEAMPHDVVVVAGKGHEDYQVLKEKTIHFDEREIIADIIDELGMN